MIGVDAPKMLKPESVGGVGGAPLRLLGEGRSRREHANRNPGQFVNHGRF